MKKRKNLLQLPHPDSSRPAGEGDFFQETRKQLKDKGFGMTSRWLFLVVAFLTILGCSSNEIKNLPPELLGHWETEASKFEGFSFELSNEAITFTDLSAKENEVEFYLIHKRTKDLDQKQNVCYTVYYKNKEGLEFPFALYYDPSGGGKIRLKNHKTIVWTRVL